MQQVYMYALFLESPSENILGDKGQKSFMKLTGFPSKVSKDSVHINFVAAHFYCCYGN